MARRKLPAELRNVSITIKLERAGGETTTVEMDRTFLADDPVADFTKWADHAVERAAGDIEHSQSQHGEQSS